MALVGVPATQCAAVSTRRGAIVARARAAEAAQLRVLSRAPVALRTSGHFGDGKTTHTFESFRRFQYGGDGAVSNTFERGHVDGKPVTEADCARRWA